LRLLAREQVEVRRAAAEALGKLGTVRAVEPLLEVFRTGGGAAAARDAVRQIQSRIEGADRGGLSLAPAAADDGALSVAPAGGELSLAGPDKKREKG